MLDSGQMGTRVRAAPWGGRGGTVIRRESVASAGVLTELPPGRTELLSEACVVSAARARHVVLNGQARRSGPDRIILTIPAFLAGIDRLRIDSNTVP